MAHNSLHLIQEMGRNQRGGNAALETLSAHQTWSCKLRSLTTHRSLNRSRNIPCQVLCQAMTMFGDLHVISIMLTCRREMEERMTSLWPTSPEVRMALEPAGRG